MISFQVKLTVQGEVANSSTILQQTFVVEYIVNNQMCDDCRRVEAKDTWNASVSWHNGFFKKLAIPGLFFLRELTENMFSIKFC